MKPYYEDGAVTLYHGDCREIVPLLGRFDAVITDPPYGVNFKYASHDDTPIGYPEWCRQWFSVLRAACDGPIAISCGISNLTEWEKPDWVLCWHKPAAMGRCVVGFNNWEPVLLYGKSRGRQTNDVFRATITPDASVEGHPCPKPLEWGKGVVSRITKENDTILDPFAGSGTTGRACKDLGRKCTMIEREERYCEIAAKRMQQEVLGLEEAA